MANKEVRCRKCGNVVARFSQADDTEESRREMREAFYETAGIDPKDVIRDPPALSVPIGAWKGRMCRQCHKVICEDCIGYSWDAMSKCGACGGRLGAVTTDAREE
ncbi:MAG: hypothetical protein H8E44_06430 [Planctomycetes bacterium]|nr:hypothetical protein [Planctomycetota bacterium]MBL7039353.1 hypothetical protein [Pirellulaceae bacterium]